MNGLSPIGLGTARLTFGPDEDGIKATVKAALDGGVTLFDTARAYSPDPERPSEGERLVAEALRGLGAGPGEVLVATKGASTRVGPEEWRLDGRPESLRQACDESLAALGVDCIDLYQLHWPDPDVPLVESAGALGELRRAGKVRLVGLSNVGIEQLEAAHAVTAIDAVQNHLGPQRADDGAVLRWCEEHDALYLAYSPQGGSMAPALAEHFPVLAKVGERHGLSAPQAALAWTRAQSKCVVPLVGSTRPATLHEALAACDTTLTTEEVEEITWGIA